MIIKNKQAYLQLVEKVRTIDPEAAEYMIFHAPHMDTLGGFKLTGDLSYAFRWFETPQGYAYWEKIYRKLLRNGWFEEDANWFDLYERAEDAR